MRALPYDAVLCDVDGVLRHWPAADDIERSNGLPPGSLAAAAFEAARLDSAITGSITDDQWRRGVARDLTALCGSANRAEAAVSAWSSLEPAVDQQVVSLLARARGVVAVALASNATTRLELDLARHGLGDAFDAVISSARIGVAKPDQRFYTIAADLLGAPAGRCLFIDDTPANVAAARQIGMTGVLYRTVEDLRAALTFVPPVGHLSGLPLADSGSYS